MTRLLLGAILCVLCSPVRAETLPEVPLAALVQHALRTLQPITEAVEREIARGILEATKAEKLAKARAYLVKTATPGGTMSRDGVANNIGKLHPEFVLRLAAAIAEARANGLPGVGLFSAYRNPKWGVCGFSDCGNSWHGAGIAGDMTGIGKAGSKSSIEWYRIAGKHKIYNPYGPYNRAEHNHYQLTMLTTTRAKPAVRAAVTAKVIDIPNIWQVAQTVISNAPFVERARPAARRYAHRRQHRRVRLASVR